MGLIALVLVILLVGYYLGWTTDWALSLGEKFPDTDFSWLINEDKLDEVMNNRLLRALKAEEEEEQNRLKAAEAEENRLNLEAEADLRVNLDREQLQNSKYFGVSDVLLPYSFAEYDETRKLLSGFSDALSVPLSIDNGTIRNAQPVSGDPVASGTTPSDILWQVGSEWMRNPVTADAAAQALIEVKLASTGKSLGRDINPFIADFVSQNDENMQKTAEGYRGWEEYLRERTVKVQRSLDDSTYTTEDVKEIYLTTYYRETVAFMAQVLDNLVYFGTTNKSPTMHWSLNSLEAHDYARRGEKQTTEETKLWYLFGYVRKDGRVEFIIGINRFDRRLGIFPTDTPEPEPETPPVVNPPETEPPETEPPQQWTPPETEPPQPWTPPETNPPETEPPQPWTPPETNPPETKPPETQPPETKPPETNPPETKPPETKPPETEPRKDPTKIPTVQTDPQGGGRVILTDPEPPSRFQPTEPTPTSPPIIWQPPEEEAETQREETQPPAHYSPETDWCYDPDGDPAVHDETLPLPETQYYWEDEDGKPGDGSRPYNETEVELETDKLNTGFDDDWGNIFAP